VPKGRASRGRERGSTSTAADETRNNGIPFVGIENLSMTQELFANMLGVRRKGV